MHRENFFTKIALSVVWFLIYSVIALLWKLLEPNLFRATGLISAGKMGALIGGTISTLILGALLYPFVAIWRGKWSGFANRLKSFRICFAEAFHPKGQEVGQPAQDEKWGFVQYWGLAVLLYWLFHWIMVTPAPEPQGNPKAPDETASAKNGVNAGLVSLQRQGQGGFVGQFVESCMTTRNAEKHVNDYTPSRKRLYCDCMGYQVRRLTIEEIEGLVDNAALDPESSSRTRYQLELMSLDCQIAVDKEADERASNDR